MSEHETPESPSADTTSGENVLVAETSPEEPLFDDEELAEFAADDAAAGGNICRMLALFFAYTILGMGISGWWTYYVLVK